MSTESDKGVVEFPVKGSATAAERPSTKTPEQREAREPREARAPIIEPREEAGTHAAEPGTPTRPSGEPLVPEFDVVTPQDAADDAATIERRPVGFPSHEWPPLVTALKDAKDAPKEKREDKDRVKTRDGQDVPKIDVESRERDKKEAEEARKAEEKKASEARELATAK